MAPPDSFSSDPDTKDKLRLVQDSDSNEFARSVDEALDDEPAPPSVEYLPGDLIADKYRLIRRLGEGGMGTVWVAKNEALDVLVAVKLIRTDQESAAHLTGRLTQEARAAAKLGHPAIMRVFDFGKTDAEEPFIVMELLHGEDLGEALQRRTNLSETKAVQTILPVVHALTAAHGKGIVHRDLKPENIFLARTDAGGIQPKIVDFGVAKLDRKGFERLTRVGALVGSPGYMSPEQARGEDVDHRADIWAVGVVLYEMIAGAPPFSGDNYNALLWSIVHHDPVPTSTQVGGDPKLWAILERGLCKDPYQRWPSMHDLGVALARWLVDNDIHEDIAGGSLQTTWFQRHSSGTDFLASVPPPGPGATPGEPEADALSERGDIATDRAPAPDESDFTPTLPRGDAVTAPAEPALAPAPARGRSRSAIAVVALLAVIGAVVAASALLLLGRMPTEPKPQQPPAVAAPALPKTPTLAPAPSAEAPSAQPTAETVARPDETPPPAASASASAAPVAAQPTGASKPPVPRGRRRIWPPKKKLKDPFQ